MRYSDNMTPEQTAEFAAEVAAIETMYEGATEGATVIYGPDCPEGEECGHCAACFENYEDDGPRAMGWVGKDGRP